MTRPNFIKDADILRWSDILESDPYTPREMLSSPVIREVCYSGLWLVEELEKLHCPESIIVRIQWTAGKQSYGRDPWETHLNILEAYKNNTLVFESEPNQVLN